MTIKPAENTWIKWIEEVNHVTIWRKKSILDKKEPKVQAARERTKLKKLTFLRKEVYVDLIQ